MMPSLTCVAQRLLVPFLFSASLAVAQTTPDLSAAREAAAQVMPKLQAGAWQSSETALQTIKQLARGKESADKQLGDKLLDLCATAVEQGFKTLPQPPEQNQLISQADHLVNWLLDHHTTQNLQRARSVIDSWEKALPEDLLARVRRLGLYIQEKNRVGQITLAAELLEEKNLDENTHDWSRSILVEALLRGKPTENEIKQAETVVTQWLEKQPQSLEGRLRLLELHRVRQDWKALYALATELLKDENLTGHDRKWVQHSRLEGALNTGRTHELNEQDWNYMLEQITGGKGLKQFIDEHGQLLLGIALAIGWLWFFIVAWITRSARARPPGFWMVTLWSTIILYASTVVMVPLIFRVIFSLLGLVFLIFATTGSRAPLGYLVAPQAATESGKARWLGVLGWCVLALLLIHPVTLAYSWAFECLLGRELESQLVAKLLQTNTLSGLAGMVLAGGIFVPFLEEVIFRGLLQDWAGRLVPAGVCVVIVSTLFGVIHGLEMAIPIAFIGMLLSLLRLRYRSLWPCIILHGLNNSVMIILLHFVPEKVL
jgi:membrane protease YdiL (CAAX protease family)